VAAAQDPSLVERLVHDNVPLDVCLTSNVKLGHFPTLKEHPFPELWRAGVNVNVSSDDPGFLSTTLTAELGHAARLANLSASDLAELQRRAARAAFAPPDVRQGLLLAIDAWEQGVKPDR
jgi:adenosine deaminase